MKSVKIRGEPISCTLPNMSHLNANMESLNKISYEIIGAVYKVHSELGPGLLESTYEVCLEYELLQKGLKLGLLLNFNVQDMKKGINRIIM